MKFNFFPATKFVKYEEGIFYKKEPFINFVSALDTQYILIYLSMHLIVIYIPKEKFCLSKNIQTFLKENTFLKIKSGQSVKFRETLPFC